jgi:hypothetical protein
MRWPAVLLAAAIGAGCSSASPSAAVDAAIDGPPDPCLACRTDQMCVARYDGTCGSRGVECVARTADCPGNVCSTACESAYCPAPFQCQDRSPCGGEPAHAFTCYGP